MKKVVSMILAIVMVAMMAVSVAAAPSVNQWVNLANISDTYKMEKITKEEGITEPEMQTAIEEAAEGIIPEGADLSRLTIMMQRKFVVDAAPYDIALRVWGSANNTLCMFFKGTEDSDWTLVACNRGEIIEATLPSNGYVVVAMAW